MDRIAERGPNPTSACSIITSATRTNCFAITVENAYAQFRNAEARLCNLDNMPNPFGCHQAFGGFHLGLFPGANPEFITLVNSENLHKAKHLKRPNAHPT